MSFGPKEEYAWHIEWKEERRTAMMHLSSLGTSVLVTGYGLVDCTQGKVDVNGYRMRGTVSAGRSGPSNRSNDTNDSSSGLMTAMPFDIPEWGSWMTIKALENDCVVRLQTVIFSSSCSDDDDEKESTSNKRTFYIHNAQEANVRPTVTPHKWALAANDILDDFHLHQQVSTKKRAMPSDNRKDDDKKIPSAKAISSVEHNGFIVAITGGKSVGKSTFLRYMLHRFLSDDDDNDESTQDAVAILDGDPGQPELGPPGLLSLTVVKKPLLSRPHSHMVLPHQSSITNHAAALAANTKHERAYYFGSASIQTDPERYMECIGELTTFYRRHLASNGIPLLLNLHGWVKGLGYQILQAILQQTCKPNHILQLMGNLRSQMFNLSDLATDKKTANSRPAMPSSKPVLHIVSAYHNESEDATPFENKQGGSSGAFSRSSSIISYGEAEATDAETTEVAASSPALNPGPSLKPLSGQSIPSSTLRTLRQVAYFTKPDTWHDLPLMQTIHDPSCVIARTLAATRPYEVPFECLSIATSQTWHPQPLIPDQLGASHPCDGCFQQQEPWWYSHLNGSIVGLCQSQLGELNDMGAAGPSSILPCVGLGIVRSIDLDRRVLCVLTPLCDPDVLAGIDVVMPGNIALPLQCTFRGVYAETFPYQSFSSGIGSDLQVVGEEPMKSRNSIGRRSLQQ